ncbi:hypothetical protein LT493_42840 [Streptomyces tricolor]|nr:hypothetical protein [Streptomyces tricolor]
MNSSSSPARLCRSSAPSPVSSGRVRPTRRGAAGGADAVPPGSDADLSGAHAGACRARWPRRWTPPRDLMFEHRTTGTRPGDAPRRGR